MDTPVPSRDVPHHRVVIVGTGFSGLGMAIRLLRRGEDDLVLLERADELGGTWRDNRYPGCACDVPSRLYSFSFEPKADWTRDYAEAGEIRDYLRATAAKHGVLPRIRYGADLRQAHWNESARRWELRAADGREWTADALVLGVGGLHEPRLPDVPGLDTFEGPLLHTARWPEVDGLDGLRVGVVGTGASVVQLLPDVAARAAHTVVFQRTPSWILPKDDRLWSPRRRRWFRRWPWLQRLVRWRTYLVQESRVVAFAHVPSVLRLGERQSRRHLARAVSDPRLRAALTPSYPMGCKRILLSNDYWPTFVRSDVDLVTSAVAAVEPGAVVAADGSRHEVDALVLGTGFDLRGSFDRIDIRGLGGRSVAEAWADGMRSHLGITLAGFPELYVLLGPNTGLGHTSVLLMSEWAMGYVEHCLDRAGLGGTRRQRGAHVVTDEAQAAFTDEIARRSRNTVWTAGCSSWYLDGSGHNNAIWPGSTVSYWWRTRRVPRAVFREVPATPATDATSRDNLRTPEFESAD